MIEDGNRKILITYDGIACNTELIVTSRSALNKHLLLQEFILCQTRSLIYENIVVRFLPIIEGRPKYFLVPSTARTPKILVIEFF